MLGNITCIYPSSCEHGESIVIDQQQNRLYWVDIPKKTLHTYCLKTKKTNRWLLPEQIGFVVLDRPGYLIGGLESGLARINLHNGELTWLGAPPDLPKNTRFNDGKKDRQGRIWANTMDLNAANGEGQLYCCTIDSTGTVEFELKDHGFTIGNGPTWSVGYRRFYHTETRRSSIFVYDFEEETGEIRNKRLFYQHHEPGVRPDGMCTDSDNHLWVALAHGGRLIRLTPEGKVEREVLVGTSFPTSCAINEKKTLFITTSQKVSAPGETTNAWSGHLLALHNVFG